MDQKIIFPTTITLDSIPYTLVKIQRGGLTAIYTNTNTFLRIGQSSRIQNNLTLHQSMTDAGFPVPEIIKNGTYLGMDYFIESSLGTHTFAQMFNQDIVLNGTISNAHFEKFLSVTKELMTAQLRTAHYRSITESFAQSINLNTLCEELPNYAHTIRKKFHESIRRLSVLPIVLTHGDFNPHNSFPEGIIDFTDSFPGFFGYDALGVLVHNDYFPTNPDYEYTQEYFFTETQKNTYRDFVDTFSYEHNLPKLSSFIHNVEFCKAVWLLVGIHAWPKLQQYRYDLFIERFLKDVSDQ